MLPKGYRGQPRPKKMVEAANKRARAAAKKDKAKSKSKIKSKG